jgi:hypothetical protein
MKLTSMKLSSSLRIFLFDIFQHFRRWVNGYVFSPLPTKWKGTLSLYSTLSISLENQFSTLFFVYAFRYSFHIWYIVSPYQVTDRDKIWFQYMDFSLSYGPWTSKNITNCQFSALFFALLTNITNQYHIALLYQVTN